MFTTYKQIHVNLPLKLLPLALKRLFYIFAGMNSTRSIDITEVFISLFPSIFLRTKNLIRQESNIILHMKYTEYHHNDNNYAGWPIALGKSPSSCGARRPLRVTSFSKEVLVLSETTLSCSIFLFVFFSRMRGSNS